MTSGKRRTFGGQRTAQRQQALFDAVEEQVRVRAQPIADVDGHCADLGQLGDETREVFVHQRRQQRFLRREVVVDAGLADRDAVGEVGITESRIAAGPQEDLGFREQPGARFGHAAINLPLGR